MTLEAIALIPALTFAVILFGAFLAVLPEVPEQRRFNVPTLRLGMSVWGSPVYVDEWEAGT